MLSNPFKMSFMSHLQKEASGKENNRGTMQVTSSDQQGTDDDVQLQKFFYGQ